MAHAKDLKYPSPRAFIDADALGKTHPLTVAALKSVERHCCSPRWREIDRLMRYFENEQYEDRPYTWDGSYATGQEVVGAPVSPGWMPPLNERRPPAVYGIAPMMTERLTGLVFGSDRFPSLKCEDDPATEDWFEGVREAGQLPSVMKHIRNVGGAAGEVFASWAWMDGDPLVEVLDPRWVQVLKWKSRIKRVPSHVISIYPFCEPGVDRDGYLVDKQSWRAREWFDQTVMGTPSVVERVWRYVPEVATKDGNVIEPARWEILEEKDLPPKYERVPIACMINAQKITDAIGKGDYQGNEGMIDDLNLVLCATTNGVALNADPTLCVNPPNGAIGNDGKPVRKGGFNTIFGDAKYVEISGSSVAAGLSTTDKLRTYALEVGRVANLDPETIGGQQSGEAMRRLMMPTTECCDGLRLAYGDRGYVEIQRGLTELARLMPENSFNVPKRVEKKVVDGVEKVVKLIERAPGSGTSFKLDWPPYFRDGAADEQAKLAGIQTAAGGRPIISPKRAIEMAKPITGVVDVEQELKDIVEGTREFAEAEAGPLGEREPDGPPTKKAAGE